MRNATHKRRHTVRFRAVNRGIFEAIRSGRKNVETRAATERYRGIVGGDTVVLVCGRDRCIKQVERVEYFRTFAAMLRRYAIHEINPNVTSAKELREMYSSFPGYREKVKKHGFIALELCK